jgi:hypothetical protein
VPPESETRKIRDSSLQENGCPSPNRHPVFSAERSSSVSSAGCWRARIQLKTTAKTSTARPRARACEANGMHGDGSCGLGAVILVLLYLSLSHLARGITIVTGCEMWEGTAMAIGLDLLIVALEVAMVEPRSGDPLG